ncbi:SHQ1-domain-containing protein [Gloeophyllum trabeum ATCC 11539]|uniref:SHQ1-domain-containing protein n=1 Tax=Gloeophyllum trabeum (strain ATCC 11539 / FP-39264 / Madison 617) TaxID=670483 RepID=S7QGT0_GLOTA|nr:SHQ1-domain-containing protein [Gloeophyllum trabeum ATCC 11539]EPQ58433.1 SHQ1-domain-containing protein [Gloeophyllum trabeum ATCC 11539]
MITPRFSCSQTDALVVVSIHCPSIRAAELETHVEDTLLTVHVNPYFLRLNFPGRVVEDEHSSAEYNPSTGRLTITLTKEVKGEEFKDLDLLAKLLAPPASKVQRPAPTIEVLSSDGAEDPEDNELLEKTHALSLEQKEILKGRLAAENDWHLPQTVPEPLPPLETSTKRPYGFLNMYSGYFVHVEHTENEVNELGGDAETCLPHERRRRRIKHEEEKWDEEHYIADYAEDDYIQELIAWKHPHTALPDESFSYSDDEQLMMLRLPRKEYLATEAQTQCLYLTLLTLLFSYAYESRTTQHDPTPESAWTICSLTPAFSALDPPPYCATPAEPPADVHSPYFADAMLATTFAALYRRSLAFPLYRSWALAEACRSDVASFLSGGKRVVTRCLLEMKHILDHHDVYYVYSKIWVDDFCTWVQAYASDDVLKDLGNRVELLHMEKAMIGWDLEELEDAVREARGREPDSDDESLE